MSEKTYIQKVMGFLCKNWDALGVKSVAWVEDHSIKLEWEAHDDPFHLGELDVGTCDFVIEAADILETTENVVAVMIDHCLSEDLAVSRIYKESLQLTPIESKIGESRVRPKKKLKGYPVHLLVEAFAIGVDPEELLAKAKSEDGIKFSIFNDGFTSGVLAHLRGEVTVANLSASRVPRSIWNQKVKSSALDDYVAGLDSMHINELRERVMGFMRSGNTGPFMMAALRAYLSGLTPEERP